LATLIEEVNFGIYLLIYTFYFCLKKYKSDV